MSNRKENECGNKENKKYHYLAPLLLSNERLTKSKPGAIRIDFVLFKFSHFIQAQI